MRSKERVKKGHFALLATGKAEPKLRFSGFSFPATPRLMWIPVRVVSPGPVLEEGEERGRLACSSALEEIRRDFGFGGGFWIKKDQAGIFLEVKQTSDLFFLQGLSRMFAVLPSMAQLQRKSP